VTESAIYTGRIRHRRHTPTEHTFNYDMCMLYLDLEELPDLLDRTPFWSRHRAALGRYKRKDFLGDPSQPLLDSVRDLVESQTGTRPGSVRLLANLRYFGHLMNPIACYYCFDASSGNLQSIVAEVTNTPWDQRHCYVLKTRSDGGLDDIHFTKQLHVSPFNPLSMEYRWRSRPPGDRLSVHLENRMNGAVVFDATLKMKRETISPGALNRLLFKRYPLMTWNITWRIYKEALKIALKRIPFYSNPHTNVACKEST